MNKKTVMKLAWVIAKRAELVHGGKVSEYISESMKMAWVMHKRDVAKKGGKILGFEGWWLEKTFNNHHSVIKTIVDSTYAIKKETEKAYYVIAKTVQQGHEVVNKFWAPKAVCM